MNIFTLKESKVIIDPAALVVPEMKAIWDRDKSKDKTIAYQELSYIFFCGWIKSPYRNMAPIDKEHNIKKDYIKDSKWKPDKAIQDAILKWEKFQETPSMRFLKSASFACEKLIEYFDSIDWTERNDKGMSVYKLSEVVSALSKVDDIRSSLQKLAEKVELESATKSVRGGGDINRREV